MSFESIWIVAIASSLPFDDLLGGEELVEVKPSVLWAIGCVRTSAYMTLAAVRTRSMVSRTLQNTELQSDGDGSVYTAGLLESSSRACFLSLISDWSASTSSSRRCISWSSCSMYAEEAREDFVEGWRRRCEGGLRHSSASIEATFEDSGFESRRRRDGS